MAAAPPLQPAGIASEPASTEPLVMTQPETSSAPAPGTSSSGDPSDGGSHQQASKDRKKGVGSALANAGGSFEVWDTVLMRLFGASVGLSWTEAEHRLFLQGLEKLGKVCQS